MRALGDLQGDPNAQLCIEFFQAMLANGREILIAAPTLAEVMRKDATKSVPRQVGIDIVGFDDVAAELLGRTFPMSVLKELDRSGTTLTHLKYDALIFACAIRHNAECIVTLDSDHKKLSDALKPGGLPVNHPDYYQSPQRSLPLLPVARPLRTGVRFRQHGWGWLSGIWPDIGQAGQVRPAIGHAMT
jgi:predicted nucleic acid-binding protein